MEMYVRPSKQRRRWREEKRRMRRCKMQDATLEYLDPPWLHMIIRYLTYVE